MMHFEMLPKYTLRLPAVKWSCSVKRHVSAKMHVSNGDVYSTSAWHEAYGVRNVCACRMQPLCSCCGTVHDE